jgi:hypothetical protein
VRRNYPKKWLNLKVQGVRKVLLVCWGNCPKPDGFVNRPRNYLLHIDQYHKVTMRWYCDECEKYFFKHTVWSKHCKAYHGQAEYDPSTYKLKVFDEKVNAVELVWNDREVKKALKLKREEEADLTEQPKQKKRRVVKNTKTSTVVNDDLREIVGSLVHELIMSLPLNENLDVVKVIDIPLKDIVVNGEAYIVDDNGSNNTEFQTINLVITDVTDDVIEEAEVTNETPKKRFSRMWQEESGAVVPCDGGNVRDAEFQLELGTRQVKLSSSTQKLKRKLSSVTLLLQNLTKKLDESEEKNEELEAINAALRKDIGDMEVERETLYTNASLNAEVIAAKNAELHAASLRVNELVGKVNGLNGELSLSDAAMDLKRKELKKLKKKVEETDEKHAVEVKGLKDEYRVYSEDLRVCTARCSKLVKRVNKLTPLPSSPKCKRFVTIPRVHYEENEKLLATAQSVAGGSANAVFNACFERRRPICSEVAAKFNAGSNPYEVGMEVTHVLLYDVWKKYNELIRQNAIVTP